MSTRLTAIRELIQITSGDGERLASLKYRAGRTAEAVFLWEKLWSEKKSLNSAHSLAAIKYDQAIVERFDSEPKQLGENVKVAIELYKQVLKSDEWVERLNELGPNAQTKVFQELQAPFLDVIKTSVEKEEFDRASQLIKTLKVLNLGRTCSQQLATTIDTLCAGELSPVKGSHFNKETAEKRQILLRFVTKHDPYNLNSAIAAVNIATWGLIQGRLDNNLFEDFWCQFINADNLEFDLLIGVDIVDAAYRKMDGTKRIQLKAKLELLDRSLFSFGYDYGWYIIGKLENDSNEVQMKALKSIRISILKRISTGVSQLHDRLCKLGYSTESDDWQITKRNCKVAVDLMQKVGKWY